MTVNAVRFGLADQPSEQLVIPMKQGLAVNLSRSKLPPLSALKAFEAAARHQKFSKAADELCLTPPAVSRHIRLLEINLGTQLFERAHRAVRLTDEGQRLFKAVSMGLSHICEVAQTIRQDKNSGKLTIAIPTSFADMFLMRRIGEFCARYPEYGLHIVASEHGPDPDQDKFDIAILADHRQSTDLKSQHLFTEEAYPVCSPGYLLDRTPIQQPSDLLNEALVHLDDAARPGQNEVNWHAWLFKYGIEIPFTTGGLCFSSHQLVIQAAVRGLGVGLGLHHLVADLIRDGSLVRPILHSCSLDRAHYIVTAKSSAKRADVQTFQAWLKLQVRGLICCAVDQTRA